MLPSVESLCLYIKFNFASFPQILREGLKSKNQKIMEFESFPKLQLFLKKAKLARNMICFISKGAMVSYVPTTNNLRKQQVKYCTENDAVVTFWPNLFYLTLGR